MVKKIELLNSLITLFIPNEEERAAFIEQYNKAKDTDDIDDTPVLLGAQKYAEPLIDIKSKQDDAIKEYQGKHFAQFRNHFKKYGIDIAEADIKGKSPMEMADLVHEKMKSKFGVTDSKAIQEMLDKANESVTAWEAKYNDAVAKFQTDLSEVEKKAQRKEVLADIKKEALLFIKKNNLGGASEETMLRAAAPILEAYNYRRKEDGKSFEILDVNTNEPVKNNRGTNIKSQDELFEEAFDGFQKNQRNEPPQVPNPNVPKGQTKTSLQEALEEVAK